MKQATEHEAFKRQKERQTFLCRARAKSESHGHSYRRILPRPSVFRLRPGLKPQFLLFGTVSCATSMEPGRIGNYFYIGTLPWKDVME